MRTIDVAAGLIFRGGKLLLSQRHPSSHLGGLWEFPGGKREADESFEACLRRELQEELGVEVLVGEQVDDVTHAYPEKQVHLRFYRCRLERGEPEPLDCAAIVWAARDELANYAFPAADARLLTKLCATDAWWAD